MTTIKVSEATDAALDWLVYECEKQAGFADFYMRWFGDGRKDAPWYNGPFKPSTDWSQGGPIIERQEIELHKWSIDGWKAQDTNYQFLDTAQEKTVFAEAYGPTPLIAAMRCYVASKLDENAEIPEEFS